MKKIALALLMLVSVSSYSATETKDFRINGDIIRVGDGAGSALAKAGQPLSQYSYSVDTGGKTTITVTDFVYAVGNEVYTVTVKEGKVSKIVWDRR